MALTLKLQPYLEERIKYLLSKQGDSDKFFNEILQYKISEMEKAIFNIEKDLRKFEKKYNQSSSEFYKRFESGELGDEDDYMIWAGIYETYIKNKEELKKLK